MRNGSPLLEICWDRTELTLLVIAGYRPFEDIRRAISTHSARNRSTRRQRNRFLTDRQSVGTK
jgi:hypothetical protein